MSSNLKASKFGLATLVATCLVLSVAWATIAQAQVAKYSLSGNTRAQIGQGLPLPVTFQPAPNGKVVLPPQAYVNQTAGADPKAMTFVLQTATPLFGPSTTTAFVAAFNTRVHQVQTSLIVNGPAAGTAMFSRGNRTGPKTFTWCPGMALPTASFNPSCTDPQATGQGITLPASLRYEATTGNVVDGWGFGGVSQALVGGGASVVIRAGTGLAPCRFPTFTGPQPAKAGCVAGFSIVNPNPIAISGGPIGGVNITNPAPSPGNVHKIAVTTNGAVTKVGPTPLGTFPKNNLKDYGGPWTTGKVTVRAPLANAGAETFYLQGSDNRVNGLGSISFVSGGVSARSISGDNANRSWQNLNVSPFSVPSISNGGLILLGAIFFAATMWMVRRAVVTSH